MPSDLHRRTLPARLVLLLDLHLSDEGQSFGYSLSLLLDHMQRSHYYLDDPLVY